MRQIIDEAMGEQEQLQMMRRAEQEIVDQRRRNAELAPKAEAYDTIRQILDMCPQRSAGMGEDVAWRLGKRIAEIETALQKQPKQED